MDAPSCLSCEADAENEAQSLGATLADAGCSPFDFAAQEEVRERVEAALRQIPEAFRTVVVLREIEGFAYEEIAEILQVNLGTIKSRLTRGRAALRRLLVPEQGDASYARGEFRGAGTVCAHSASATGNQSQNVNGNRVRGRAASVLDSRGEPLMEVSR